MNELKPVRIRDLKAQAIFLLKGLQSNPDLSRQSARRFLELPEFSGKTENWLIEHSDAVRLKHAYKVIALEHGTKGWADLKHIVVENDCLYRPSCVAFVYSWFSNYPQAEIYFKKHGGYLLSFWRDFVVCGKEYICCIGLGDTADL